jgi:hypothetical protein
MWRSSFLCRSYDRFMLSLRPVHPVELYTTARTDYFKGVIDYPRASGINGAVSSPSGRACVFYAPREGRAGVVDWAKLPAGVKRGGL